MSVIGLLLTIAIYGVIVWLVLQLPMPGIFKNVIIAAASILVVIWLLQSLGVVTGLPVLNLK